MWLEKGGQFIGCDQLSVLNLPDLPKFLLLLLREFQDIYMNDHIV